MEPVLTAQEFADFYPTYAAALLGRILPPLVMLNPVEFNKLLDTVWKNSWNDLIANYCIYSQLHRDDEDPDDLGGWITFMERRQ